MPLDRRTFVVGGAAAAAGVALASCDAVVAAGRAAVPASLAGEVSTAVAAAPSFELRIVGWHRIDTAADLRSTPPDDTARWIAIDNQWRGGWH